MGLPCAAPPLPLQCDNHGAEALSSSCIQALKILSPVQLSSYKGSYFSHFGKYLYMVLRVACELIINDDSVMILECFLFLISN